MKVVSYSFVGNDILEEVEDISVEGRLECFDDVDERIEEIAGGCVDLKWLCSGRWTTGDHNVVVLVAHVASYDRYSCLDVELVDVSHVHWCEMMGENLQACIIMFPRQGQERCSDCCADAVEEGK